jgi:hypothetical protein
VKRQAVALALTLAITAAVTWIVAMPVCDWLHDCGCTWPWAGGESRCNMHNPQPPHCPVCKGDRKAQAALAAVVGVPAFGIAALVQARLRRR